MQKFILIPLFIFCFSLVNAQTPAPKIFAAVKNNDLEEVQRLLQQGADPNAVDEDGDPLLMYAALFSSVDCMKLLIEKGSDPNAKNNFNETALMSSSR